MWNPSVYRYRGRIGLATVWFLLGVVAFAQEPDALSVRVKISGGNHFVGQGFELQVEVVASGRRPEVDRPSIPNSDVWLIENSLKPISTSEIGGMSSEANLFLYRYRVVPRRPGFLEIPSIRAKLGNRSGRSRSSRVSIRPLPTEGRPAEFLGGIGPFTLVAEMVPDVVRVAQELELRITITGSPAWGMVDFPELKRFDRLRLGWRIQPKSADLIKEPPSRTFVYRLRPTRAGEEVLPPVAIAVFDPASSRYTTQVTPGLPVRVVAVPSFDSSSIAFTQTSEDLTRSRKIVWAVALSATLLLILVWIGLARVRRGIHTRRLSGFQLAKRFALVQARKLGSSLTFDGLDRRQAGEKLGLEIREALIRYLQLGIGRPPGALTPEEASLGVMESTGSRDLSQQAATIAARCDVILYRDVLTFTEEHPGKLREDARGLFESLGRVRISRRLANSRFRGARDPLPCPDRKEE